MARIGRSVHENAFGGVDDFNTQLYHALKASPWWMISLSAHVLLYVISSLAATPAIARPEASQPLTTTRLAEAPPEFPPDDKKDLDEVVDLER